jgi:hypothetical protein
MNWDDDEFDFQLPASGGAGATLAVNDGADWDDEDVMEAAAARVAAPAERRANKPKHLAKDKAAAFAASSEAQAARLRAIEEEFGPPSSDPVQEKWRQEQIRQRQDLLFAGDTFGIDDDAVAGGAAAGSATETATASAPPQSDEALTAAVRAMGISEMKHMKAVVEALVLRAKNMNSAKNHVSDLVTLMIETAGPHMKPAEIDSLRSVLTAAKKQHTEAKKATAKKAKPTLAKFKAVSTASKDYGGAAGDYDDLGAEFDDFM